MADINQNKDPVSTVEAENSYENDVMFFLAPEEYFPRDTNDSKRINKTSVTSSGSDTPGQENEAVTLYQPRPTLKELEESKAKRRAQQQQQKALQTSGVLRSRSSDSTTSKSPSSLSESFDDALAAVQQQQQQRDDVMKRFARQEEQFRDQFQIAAENLLLQHSGGGGGGGALTSTSEGAKLARSASHYRQKHAGFRHLNNLVTLMTQLNSLQHENTSLRKKCVFLEDTKALVSVQYQMQSLALHKQHLSANRTSRLLTMAGKHMKHVFSPTSGSAVSPLHSYSRGTSEVSSAYTTDAIEEKKPKSPVKMPRSSSFGSIDDLDTHARREMSIVPTSAAPGGLMLKPDKAPSASAAAVGRKKSNKRFTAPKWSKMKRVFGKPESASSSSAKSEPPPCAVSAEEIVRMNKKGSNDRYRLASSAGGGGGGAAISAGRADPPEASSSPWIVSDKLLLGVDPPKSSPPSPSSVQSEPGTSFPDITHSAHALENEYAEIGPPTVSYVTVDKQQSEQLMADLWPASEQDATFASAYSDRLTTSDLDLDNLALVTPRLVRRKSSPNLSMSSLNDVTELLSAPDDRLRRASSYKNTKSDRKHFKSRSASNAAYIGRSDRLTTPDVIAGGGHARFRADQEELHRRARAAWLKVKDMIQVRKESVKKQRRARTSSNDDVEFEISPDGSSWEDRHNVRSDVEYDYADHFYHTISREGSPKLIGRRNTVKATSSSPQMQRKMTRNVRIATAESSLVTSTAKKKEILDAPAAGAQFDVTQLAG